MTRWIPVFTALWACSPDKGGDPVEITGYLDAGRIAVTTASDPGAGSVTVVVAGGPEATDLDRITVTNLDTGGSVQGAAARDGSFAILFAAAPGETLEISGGAADPVQWTFQAPPPFPDYVSLLPAAPNAEGMSAFTLELTAPHPNLDVLLSNVQRSASAWMSRTDATYTGAISAAAGDIVWVLAVSADQGPTRAVELPVPAN